MLLAKKTNPAQALSLLHSQDQLARDISHDVNSGKTCFMPFNHNGAFTSLNDKLLKFINLFIYLGINILSTESDIDTRMGKSRTAIDRLTNISKFNLSDERKTEFLTSSSHVGTTVWLHYSKHQEIK